jgi:AraC-like DNA-binding protein
MFQYFFFMLVTISVFLAFVLSVFFLFTPRGNSSDNRILALLLLVFDFQIIFSFMTSWYGSYYFMAWHKQIFLLRQTSFLTGPLFYFYVLSFLKKRNVTGMDNLWHFLPFTASIVFLLIYYRSISEFVIWESILDFYDTILILASNFVYILLSWNILRKEKAGFGGLIRNLRTSPHLTWLQIIAIGFIALWVVNLNSFALFMIIRRPGWCAYTVSIYTLTAFIFLNAVMLILMMKPDIFYVMTKYRNSRLEEDDKSTYLQKLRIHMESNKPYLDPEISLESLADGIGMTPRLLSQIINETYRKSFKQFILEYRLNESMKILADCKAARLTILEVLYQVGFNSKSTFNNQFKLYTKLTPQEFRAQALRNHDMAA